MKNLLTLTLFIFVTISIINFSGCNDQNTAVSDLEGGGGDGGPEDDDHGEIGGGDNLVSEKFGIYVGKDGKIYQMSGDTNITITKKISGTSQNLNGVCIRSGTSTVLAVGYNGTIVRSTNKGNTWTLINPVTTSDLNDASFGFGGYDFSVGSNGTILRSSNYGLNWSVVASGSSNNLNAVSSDAAGNGYVVAAGEKGTILRSTSYGFNWNNVNIPDTTVNFYCINKPISFGNEIYNFHIAGSQGKIFKSTNRGATWVSKNSGTTHTLRSIYFVNEDSGVVVGDSGTVRFTTNAGETWFSNAYFDAPSGRNYKTVSLIDPVLKIFSAMSDTVWFKSEQPITIISSSYNLNLTSLIEGFYDPGTNLMVSDSVKVYLRNSVSPFVKVDSAKVKLNSSGNGTFKFFNITNGTGYYIAVKHRNSIETWSGSANIFTSNSLIYDFTTASNKAFGNNMKQVDSSPVKFALHSGDANQDGFVNLSDVIKVNNDANVFAGGYIVSDMNGDNIADLTDVVITNNNSSMFVSIIQP